MVKYLISFILLLLILLLTSSALNAQNQEASSLDINKKIPVSALQQDLAVLKDSLEIRHPALYRFISMQSLDAAFQAAARKITGPMSLGEFYGVAAPLISKVGDIHTSVGLPDEYHNAIAANAQLFPFDVRIINKEVFIASNNSRDSTIPAGSKIIQINGQPVTRLLNRMQSYFSSDGYNETFPLRVVEQRFAFHYRYVYGHRSEFRVMFLKPGAQAPQTRKIAALSFDVIREKRARNKILHPGLKPLFQQPPHLSLSLNNQYDAAILAIETLEDEVLISSDRPFTQFIDSAFTIINALKIKNLIIDIRNNNGGSSFNAGYLYSYLASRPFRFLYAMEANSKAPKNDTVPAHFFGLDIQQPQANNFTGNVYVLMDGMTVSSGAQIAILIRQNRRGVLIGEEAAGSLYGGSGRGYSYFHLPHSGLLVMISHYRLYMADPVNNSKHAPLVPDYPVTTTINDLLNGRDKYIEFVYKLIKVNQ